MLELPSAETRYAPFPGVDVAERALVRRGGVLEGGTDEDHAARLDAYLAGDVSDVPGLSKRPTKLVRKVRTFAEVRQGRWLVACPWCTIGGKPVHYQFAAKTDPRFFCTDCHNAQGGGEFVRVIWPDDATVTQIEQLLTRRANVYDRNWLPGEPIEQLVRENDELGIS